MNWQKGLPEESGRYLICLKNYLDGKVVAHTVELDYFSAEKRNSVLKGDEGNPCHWSRYFDGDIVAWMPLPKPYKAE